MTTEQLLNCPVCSDEEPVKQNGIVGLTVMCHKPNCVANFPIPYAIWQSIPRFPDHLDTELCQHCEQMVPGDEYATPFDRGNAIELVQALEEGNEVGPAAWDLLRKCVRSPRNWKYCDTRDCKIVGSELKVLQAKTSEMVNWREKARAAEAQLEKMLRQGVVQFASEQYLKTSDTLLLPPCPRCDQLPAVDGNVIQHYEECDDHGEHGSGRLLTYTVADWWKHIALETHCQNCLCRPGRDYDDYPSDDDPELSWSDESETYYHSCGCGESSNGYTTVGWWFENTSLLEFSRMPNGEELLSMYLQLQREKAP